LVELELFICFGINDFVDNILCFLKKCVILRKISMIHNELNE